ncbi:hypothetical protein RHGRI_016243 [Rhododendron griersonianum]|uniref:LNS2/PITP domain-containing protein n=1 Tax=Rhododendron griersonianum TaxID=479676 RepID=A0AAV6JTG7_9ERIC|nr:hypothetical protein RHGRI_016243 [Rhododendron griersonianum]
MYTVGRLGSYISKGVYTVSGPFHPFGGAVDIIVVEQQDGSFKSSPWYVRFGKFQGVLKAKEKVVSISVDGVQADFHMYLDSKGEAYFLKEVDVEEGGGDSGFSPSSSGEDTDGQSGGDKGPMKSKTFDANGSNLVTQIDITNGKILKRTNSRRSRILGLVFGRKSTREEGDRSGVVGADSLKHAEIAADLLELKWSTNLASSRYKKMITSQSAPERLEREEDEVVDSPLNDNKVSSLNSPMSKEETGIHDNGTANSSWDGLPKLDSSDDGVEMLCLSSKQILGTSSSGERGLQENYDLDSRTVREVYKLRSADSDHDENSKGFISEATSHNPDSAELNVGPNIKLDEEQVFKEESGAATLEAFSYSEMVEAGDSGGKTHETLCVSCEGAEACVHAKMLHEIAEMISEVQCGQDTSLLVAKENLDHPEIFLDGNCGNLFNEAQICGSEGTCSKSSGNSNVAETYAHMVIVEEINSEKEVESCSVYTVSGFDNSISQVQDGEKSRVSPVADSLEFTGDNFSIGPLAVSLSEVSDEEQLNEEQLLFGDIDDFNQGETKCTESSPSNQLEYGNLSPDASKYSEAVIKALKPDDKSHLSSDKCIQQNALNDVEDFREKTIVVSSCINIPRSKSAGEEFRRMAESLPNMWSQSDDMVVDGFHHPLGHSLDANPESSKLTPLGEDFPSPVKSDADKQAQPTVEDAQTSEELKSGPANPAVGNQTEGIDATNGSWRVWPFRFKKSRSMEAIQPAQNSTGISNAENALGSSTGMVGEKDGLKPKVKSKKVRVLTPTPEQLASLNLKEGKNTVNFTFSTSMLGPQQFAMNKIVICAVLVLATYQGECYFFGSIGLTLSSLLVAILWDRSDVLGQFMPMVGMDWSQTGVAHLFSAIKENGYQLLFLSARAISQAYNTRRFLFNLKQDGKALPDGPVVISPDGLFPSLYREVIRRAPHEFKIGCLEDIKALFPSDRNPFYAGFGNRDTDEFSYIKVGIPKGKIFIINPKGEVVVNRRVDSKSYSKLQTLVQEMFPPISSSEHQVFSSLSYG